MIKQASILCLALAGIAAPAAAQKGNKKPSAPAKNAAGAGNGDYKVTARGMQYKLLTDAPGTNVKIGDVVVIQFKQSINDSVLADSRAQPAGTPPTRLLVAEPQFNGDIMEGFPMLSPGDKAIFRLPVDSIPNFKGQPLPSFMHSGDKLDFEIELVSVMSEAEMKAEQEKAQAEQAKAMAEQQRAMEEMQAREARQAPLDDSLIQVYLKKKGIKNAKKTASGLYYSISKLGTGPKPVAGDNVSMKYTGKLTNDTLFDSNIEPRFNHVEPFEFPLGQGRVIKGWDEGIALLPKGSKATLYIPSGLAYGGNVRPGGPIPAFSILVFDVEVVDIKKSATPPVEMMPTPRPKQ